MHAIDFCKKHRLKTLRLIHGKKIPTKNSKGVHDSKHVEDASYYDGYNIGIAGGHGFAILDFDPRNYNEQTAPYLDKLSNFFPDTVAVLTPSQGFHLYYEYDEGLTIPSFDLAPGIQLIAENKYALSAGCYNAELKRRYDWHPDLGPDLELERLPEWILDVAAKHKTIEVKDFAVGERLDDDTMGSVEAALAYLDPDMTEPDWFKVGLALHSTGHPKAFQVFEDWSKRGKKYKEGDCAKKWVRMISTRGVTHLTILKKASEAGWVEPDVQIEGMENWEVTSKKDPHPRVRSEPLPLPKLPGEHFPGFVKAIYNCAPYKMPNFSIHTALAIVGYHCQPRFLTPTGSGLGLYQVIHTQSGDGKGYYTGLISRFCDNISSAPVSGGGLKQEVSGMGNSIYVDSEISGNCFYSLFGREKSPQAKKIANTTIDLYDLDGKRVITGESAKTDAYKVKALKSESYSIFGSCTTADIGAIVNDGTLISTGFLNRYVIIADQGYTPLKRPKFNAEFAFDLDAKFINRLPEALPEARMELCWDEENEPIWGLFTALRRKYYSRGIESNLIKRVDLNALRIASIVHSFELTCSGRLAYTKLPIPEELLRWAWELSLRSNTELLHHVEPPKKKETADTKLDKMIGQTIRVLSKATDKTAKKSDVTKGTRFSRPEWDRAFEHMVKIEQISIEKVGRARQVKLLTDD